MNYYSRICLKTEGITQLFWHSLISCYFIDFNNISDNICNCFESRSPKLYPGLIWFQPTSSCLGYFHILSHWWLTWLAQVYISSVRSVTSYITRGGTGGGGARRVLSAGVITVGGVVNKMLYSSLNFLLWILYYDNHWCFYTIQVQIQLHCRGSIAEIVNFVSLTKYLNVLWNYVKNFLHDFLKSRKRGWRLVTQFGDEGLASVK